MNMGGMGASGQAGGGGQQGGWQSPQPQTSGFLQHGQPQMMPQMNTSLQQHAVPAMLNGMMNNSGGGQPDVMMAIQQILQRLQGGQGNNPVQLPNPTFEGPISPFDARMARNPQFANKMTMLGGFGGNY